MKKHLIAFLLLSVSLLLMVIVYGWCKSLFTQTGTSLDQGYTTAQIIQGIMAESLRAILTIWLYAYHRSDKSSIKQATLFGLVCSFLIGSFWIILGAQLVHADFRLAFIVDDSLILLLQGIATGLVLWIVYKEKE